MFWTVPRCTDVADTDGNGEIDMAEFCELILGDFSTSTAMLFGPSAKKSSCVARVVDDHRGFFVAPVLCQ